MKQEISLQVIAKNMAEAIREWNRAKLERESWIPAVGQVPPVGILGSAKMANAMLTKALQAYDDFVGPQMFNWAEEKGSLLLGLPSYKLPPLAEEYANYYCDKHGHTNAMYLVAFYHYVQYFDKLDVKDGANRLTPEALDWFHRKHVLKDKLNPPAKCDGCGKNAITVVCDLQEVPSNGPDRRFTIIDKYRFGCADHPIESKRYDLNGSSI